MAADLQLPKQLLVHGWIKIGQQKMSKSLGNVVDPEVLYKHYGADPVRYYLLRQIAITHDSEFNIKDLEERITSDLANDLGNLLNRMLTLAFKHDLSHVPVHTVWNESGVDLRNACWDAIADYEQYMNGCLYHMALARLWKYINQVNSYFHANEPWKLAKINRVKFTEVISAVCHSLYTIGYLLWPVMPSKMEELLKSLGMVFEIKGNALEMLTMNRWDHEFYLQITQTLFEKYHPLKDESPMLKEEPEREEEKKYASIDQFAAVELRVGTIENCESIPKSDKLYKLRVNFGDHGIRQILAGVKKSFEPDELIGKQAVFVFNLKPRKMLGMESQGMMLVVKNEEGKLELVVPEKPVANGARLQ